MTIIVKEIKKEYSKKPGTKNGWKLEITEERECTPENVEMVVDACPFFRRLGGSEYVERNHTKYGYSPTRLISKSPDRERKIIREWKYI